MAVLYIAGSQRGAGKTALATALAGTLTQGGRSVAIVKPLRLVDEAEPDSTPDRDSTFYRQLLPDNPQPQGWPLAVTADQLASDPELLKRVPELVAAVAAGAETTIVEGLDGLGSPGPVAEASAAIAQSLDARVVGVAQYASPMGPTPLAEACHALGTSLLGLIINNVPGYRTHDTAARLIPALDAEGIPVLGAVPEDRRMLAPSVADLAAHLQGEFRLLEERSEELVESVMVGGFFLDPGDYVFSRRDRKAVIARADRPDLQMAALGTSTVCLVLTGGQNPIQYVTYHAEQEEVPIILVDSPTLEAMERLHTLADGVTVHNPRKVARFQELLGQHSDLKALWAGLGVD